MGLVVRWAGDEDMVNERGLQWRFEAWFRKGLGRVFVGKICSCMLGCILKDNKKVGLA